MNVPESQQTTRITAGMLPETAASQAGVDMPPPDAGGGPAPPVAEGGRPVGDEQTEAPQSREEQHEDGRSTDDGDTDDKEAEEDASPAEVSFTNLPPPQGTRC